MFVKQKYRLYDFVEYLQNGGLSMLLEFKTANYKSFADEMIFSMSPAPKQKGLDYSIQTKKIGVKTYKAISSAIVYGPNASGKTNIIGAMDTMKSIVMRGNIKNTDVPSSMNVASALLELIPNQDIPASPTKFSIRFIENDILVDYSLSIELGEFLSNDFPRRILEEKLYINEKPVFLRKEKLEINIPSCITKFMNSSIKNVTEQLLEISESSLNHDELFLNNGFKNIFAKNLVSLIQNWFDKKFIVIMRSDSIKIMRKFSDKNENTIYVEKTLTDASKIFGINSNALGYKLTSDGDETVLCSIFNDKKAIIPAEQFESYGTVRFINEFPLVMNALTNGGTLVMDEFDASIHPMALMNIINIFHNDEININKAQLIFNTHNPIFLDASLFRRDEIKFVERDDANHSIHYALSDFKTANGVRKGEDYMNNYFVNRYGAIKEVDFSPVIEQVIRENGANKND